MPFRVETIISGLRGSPGYNRMHFDSTFFDNQAGADAAATAARNFWNTIRTEVSNVVSFAVQTEVQLVDNTGAPTGQFFVAPPAGVQGSSSGDPLPWVTQALVQWRTGQFRNNREVRGRMYIPGLTETSNVGGGMTAATQTALRGAANALVASEPRLVVLARTGPAEVISSNVLGQWSYLRSRRD